VAGSSSRCSSSLTEARAAAGQHGRASQDSEMVMWNDDRWTSVSQQTGDIMRKLQSLLKNRKLVKQLVK
jgi:hypothetical protein